MKSWTWYRFYFLETKFHCRIFKNREKVMIKTLFKFSNLTPRASFLFWNLEIARNFHFYFLCYFSMSKKSKNLVKRHRRCISLLRPYYAFLYFLYFVHGCWCFFFDLLIKSSIHNNNLFHWKIKHCCDQSNSYSKKGIRNLVFEPYTYFCVESEFRNLFVCWYITLQMAFFPSLLFKSTFRIFQGSIYIPESLGFLM